MADWIDFEQNCTDYLRCKFGQYANFKYKGGRDSTTSDIHVHTTNGKKFFIEAKKCPAQSGQFVLLPDTSTRTFKYSDSNAAQKNDFSAAIIAHMNNYFDEYRDSGTKGRDINIENGNSIFTSWIIQYYKIKGVKFVITNNNILLPVEDFACFFKATATYRIKRSGSSNVAKANVDAVKDYLTGNCDITSSYFKDKKLFITSKYKLDKERFFVGDNEYMISERGSVYEIRKLSDTFNANVIFSIDLIPGKQGLSDTEFISFLK